MNVTVCEPAGTLTPTLGVLPRGLPSRMTLDTGIEFMLSVPFPERRPLLLSGGSWVAPGPGRRAHGGRRGLADLEELDLHRLLGLAVLEGEILGEVVEALLGGDEAPVLRGVDVEAHGRGLEHRVGELLLDLLLAAADEGDGRVLGTMSRVTWPLTTLSLISPRSFVLAGGELDRLLELLVALAAVEADLVGAGAEVLELGGERALVGAVDDDVDPLLGVGAGDLQDGAAPVRLRVACWCKPPPGRRPRRSARAGR